MSDAVVARIAAALAEHRGGTGHSGDWECSCGREGPEKTHDLHVASVVAALPDIAIVELPVLGEDETLSEFHGRLEMAWAGVRFRRYSAAIDVRAALDPQETE